MSSKNRIVDIIKYLASILVIFSHSYHIAENNSDILGKYTNGFLEFGGCAVCVFFAISGYFIAKSLEKKGTNNFLENRLFRIFPSLVFVVFFSVFIVGPLVTILDIGSYFSNKSTYVYLLNCVTIPIHNLPGVFTNNVFSSTVNGSLWTMIVQLICYVYIFIFFKLRKRFSFKYINELYLLFSIVACVISYFIINKFGFIIFAAFIRPFLTFVIGSYLYMKKINDK